MARSMTQKDYVLLFQNILCLYAYKKEKLRVITLLAHVIF